MPDDAQLDQRPEGDRGGLEQLANRALPGGLPYHRRLAIRYGGDEMAEGNQEIVAAILAAGIMGAGQHVRGHVREDTVTVLKLYHSCLTEIKKAAQEEREPNQTPTSV